MMILAGGSGGARCCQWICSIHQNLKPYRLLLWQGMNCNYQSINQSKRKTSNANGQTNLGHKHKAPDHNHEATQPMVDLPHTS